ncbi:NAD(P)H dehydrogenase (quinone) [Kribbella flavida DSM 17836]|uniref:FMN dependent NADH:quinone oxidoreductase n=1 Tax=Kribbella flavida (strain DSM 17836 / JCM 10339 / NBRC 14399) TaxID=479435 RepID=D2Q372_KRIFD|nr:NAD(P)H-dependent oxidoreductase [Kribbella flavida]ADB32197.1 NAD(P)H dehydrogenase (quinone) [Kribbella flavida DSM 17836]
MTTLLRIDASIRVEGSVSRALADSAEAAWKSEHPDGVVLRRDLGLQPIPTGVWAALIGAQFGQPVPNGASFADAAEAKELAETLINEFKSADAVLLAVPLYNYGIAQHVKTYLDVLLTDQELLTGGGQVAGRPVIFTLARGGGYGPGAPKEGWDHATPYLSRIFGEVFNMKVRIAAAELTLAPVTPGMEQLIDASKVSQQEAHSTAEEHAAEVARILTTTAA